MPACKKCQREIATVEAQFCPYCGAPIGDEGLFEFNAQAPPPPAEAAAPAPAFPDAYEPFSPPPRAEAKRPTDWEDRANLGFLRGLSQTLSDATLRPSEFFRRTLPTGNIGSALLFALLVWMTAGLISLFWQSQMMDSFPLLERLEREFSLEFGREQYGLYVLVLPFWMTLVIFVSAAIFHVCLLLVGSGRSGWEATFRALCYSFGPQLLSVLPVCGGIIAMFWQLSIVLTGWREFHQSSTPRVALAAFLPLILCCGFASYFLFRFADVLSNLNLPQ